MPPDPVTVETARKWLRYARSDYQLAQMGPVEGVLWETLVFHAQQTAEKAFKAVLTYSGIDFPPTHNLAVLRDLLPATLFVPRNIEDTTGLSVLPPKSYDDALHVAICSVNEMDALLSWNYAHLSNIKERHFLAVNQANGYLFPMRIVTPLEVMSDD